MTMVRGGYAKLLAPGQDRIFVEWTQTLQRELEYPVMFNVETSKRAYEDAMKMVGVGPLQEKTENAAIFYQDAAQGGSKRFIHLTYALGCRTSWELYEDDLYGIIKQVPKSLARSARFTEEMVAWNVINQGFATVKSIDGVSLFNAAHPLQGGPAATNIGPGVGPYISAPGTYPNRPAVDVDISYAAIQTMTNQFERLIDSQGMPIAVKPKFLVIPPELRFTARELLGSPGKPGVNTNEINALLGEDLTYVISHYLTSATAWFASVPKDQQQLMFYRRHPIDSDYDDDFDTRALKQVSFTRFSAGVIDWLGLWGSNGP